MGEAQTRFVWLDMEMTGLDVDTCVPIEVGVIVTGPDLKPLAELHRVIWQPEELLSRMEPFVREMHTKNGLLEKVRASTTSLATAEREVLELLTQHCKLREGILAGNSIHSDRKFIERYMPVLDGYLHYRMLDVSSLKVLTRAWYPGGPRYSKDDKEHTAIADLKESLSELAFYRRTFFKS
ncbi:MAG: oligoribonuclease [Myxococcota bacterium]